MRPSEQKQDYYNEILKMNIRDVPGIYSLIINDKIYVGSAVNLFKRLNGHTNDLLANRHGNPYLQRAFNKHGNIQFKIIEYVMFKEDLVKREQYHIDKLKPKYNLAPRAGSMLGFKHSEETRKKISAIQIGKKLSPDVCKRMGESRRGIKRSEETRKKLSLAKMGDKNPFYKAGKNHPQYGTRRKPETIAKLSGKNNASSKSGFVYDAERDSCYVFQCLKTICKHIGVNYYTAKSAARNQTVLGERYRVTYCNVPKECETKFPLPPLINQIKINTENFITGNL